MQLCSCSKAVEVFWASLCLISRLWTHHLQIRNTPTVLWASAAVWLLCLSACPCYPTTNYNSPLMPILLSFQCCLSKVCGPAPSHHCHLLLTAHCNACFLFALQLTKFRESRKKEMDFPVLPQFSWIHCLQNENESTFWRLKVESCCFSHGSFWIYFYASGELLKQMVSSIKTATASLDSALIYGVVFGVESQVVTHE